MPRASQGEGREPTAEDAAMREVIGIVEELISLVEGENRDLARGLPATLTGSTRRKTELADAVEQWVGKVQAKPLHRAAVDSALRERLSNRIAALRVVMDENVGRLRQAIAASQRRVDAIMRVIRDEVASRATYGRNGQVGAPRASGSWCGRGVQA